MKINLFHFVRESQLFTLQIKLFLTNWIPTGDKVSNDLTFLTSFADNSTKTKILRNNSQISLFKSPRELKTRLCFNEPRRRKVITLTETPDGSRWSRKVSTYCTTESCDYELNSTTKLNLQIGFKVHNLKNKNKLNYIISNLYVSCSEYKTKNNKVLKQLLYGYSG